MWAWSGSSTTGRIPAGASAISERPGVSPPGGSPDGSSREGPESEGQFPSPKNLYQLAWVFYLILAIGGGGWVASRPGGLSLAFFLDLQRWWLDFGLGLGAGAILLGLWALARRTLPGAIHLEESLSGLVRGGETSEVLALAALSGFAEELFFRGAVQGAWGLVPATVLFALLHTGPGAGFRLWTLFAAAAGLLLGGLVVWRGNLSSAVVGHFLVNAVNLHRLARQPAPAAGRREGAG